MASPLLNPQFFKDHPPERELYQRFAGQFPWSEELMPVYEWDHLVYIACSDPLAVREKYATWPSHWVLVRAEAQDLTQTWQRWHEDHTQPRYEMPELHEETVAPVIPAAEVKTPAIPASAPAAKAPNSNSFDPDSLFADLEKSEVRSLSKEEKSSSFDEINLADGFPAGSDSEENHEPEEKVVSAEPMDSPEQLEGLSLDLDTPPVSISLTSAEAPKIPETTPLAKAPAQPVAASAAPSKSVEHKELAYDEASLQTLLGKTPEHYQGLLFAVKAGNSVRVKHWSKSISTSNNVEFDFSLATPSPFRICVKTEKAFHGYLTENPYLDKFFGSWNKGTYPETLTVVPVLNGESTLGFVVAFGDKEASSKKNLGQIERLADDVLHLLDPTAAEAKAS